MTGNPQLGINVTGSYNTLRNNELSGNVSQDILVGNAGQGNVIMANVYCKLNPAGLNTVITGNVDRVDNC